MTRIEKLRTAYTAMIGLPGSKAQMIALIQFACQVDALEAESLFDEIRRRQEMAYRPQPQPKG